MNVFYIVNVIIITCFQHISKICNAIIEPALRRVTLNIKHYFPSFVQYMLSQYNTLFHLLTWYWQIYATHNLV